MQRASVLRYGKEHAYEIRDYGGRSLLVCMFAVGCATAATDAYAQSGASEDGLLCRQLEGRGHDEGQPEQQWRTFSLTESGEWVTDGFFLETHTSMKSPMGHINSVRVMGYNAGDKVYTYNVYNSLGEHQMATGHLQGNTWTWIAEQKMNGVITKGRYTMTIVTPDSYTFKSEVATPSGGWSTVME